MARERDYQAEYARRKARGRARGQTGSEYRGHKPKSPGKTEAAERREREEREAASMGKLTTPQRSRVRAFARERIAAVGPDDMFDSEEDEIENFVAWATQAGWEHYQSEVAFFRALGMQGMTMDEIELRAAIGEGFPNPKWYFYRTKEQMRGREWSVRSPAQKAARRRRDRERRARRKRARRKAA